MNSAVLFLVFNRPDTTARVFDAIRAARPPRLYVAADGPRPNRQGGSARCELREQRYTRVSTRITTNFDFDGWHDLLQQAPG